MKPRMPLRVHDVSSNGHATPAGLLPRRELQAGVVRHVTKSLKKRWKRYRKELKGCQKNLSEKAIHDFRVESRRMLSLVELLGGFVRSGSINKIERAVKEHLDTFDDLRDAQVQLPSVRKLVRTFTAARPLYVYLALREARLLKQTRKAIKRLRTRGLGKLLDGCRAEAETKCDEGAAGRLLRVVARAFARAVRLRAGVDPLRTQTIHRTRIAFKKFRYMAEALAEHLPGTDEETLAAMHHYQTMMGNIQDAEVLLRTLDGFLKKERVAREPAQRLREELVRRRNWRIQIFMEQADPLDGFQAGAKARSGADARRSAVMRRTGSVDNRAPRGLRRGKRAWNSGGVP